MPPPSGPRDPIAGPETPSAPFPLKLSGKIIKGFGRGSKELGIPTANIPLSGLSVGGHSDLDSGIYFGWAGLDFTSTPVPSTSNTTTTNSSTSNVYPMVMSLGYNPFYKNTVRSVEVHIMHDFASDFYGAHMSLIILGFIRPEYDYVSKESLIEDIRTDIEVARRSLAREAYVAFKEDRSLVEFGQGQEGSEENGKVIGS
ncbi:riboflavin kinase [Lepidopterella palustris CBS 459.81]|uniref:Riboflavin kinase n=1 Tax=Lepidopterella palustris CBS 459.81 TaxID=1314670 RepID=A0A8E2EBH5_9PEZI|nr:riboflavin kinase [Lepidopterella palustris CBS 459.81]